MAATVGFFDVVGSRLRAPFCNWRARLAATMIKRYALDSGSSGITLWALGLRLVSDIAKALQYRTDFIFHPIAPAPSGFDDGHQRVYRLGHIAIHQHVIVKRIIANLSGCVVQAALDDRLGILRPRAQPLLQYLPAGRQDKNGHRARIPL